LAESLPKRLELNTAYAGGTPDPRYMVDENGDLFDTLRDATKRDGTRSALTILQDTIKQTGGNYSYVQGWAQDQGGSSWNPTPVLVKEWYSLQRDVPYDNYFRRKGIQYNGATATNWNDVEQGVKDTVATMYNGTMAAGATPADLFEAFQQTYAVQNAFSYALLERTTTRARRDDFGDPYTVRVVRTEPKIAVRGLAEGQVAVIARGAMESTSAITAIRASGGPYLTVQDVPIHRVMGTYMQGRNDAPNGAKDMFLGIGENEYVAHLEGLPMRYIRELGTGGRTVEGDYGAMRDAILDAPTLNDIPAGL
jgi:hypothetical protein